MNIFKGAVLTILMRWSDRLIGFVSTLILARLLVPDDFGIIAMASLVIGLVDVLLDLGVHVALIQNRHVTAAHYHTAWTLRLIQAAIVALVIFLGAPKAAEYFSDIRLEPVLQVMTVSLLLASLENIGVINFQKEMQFGLDFRFTFIKRMAGFLTTISVAYLWPSYWALVIGTLAGRTVGVLISYSMHPMRPRCSLEKVKDIFSVSQWMLLNSIGNYLNGNLHKILVGRRGDASVMGGYTLADDISAMPSSEVLAPISRVLFPAFVHVKHDLIELKRLFLLAQGVQTIVAVPASLGLALVAYEAVFILLGEKWLFAVPFVQVLALAYVIHAITASGCYVMIAMGQVRNLALLTWVQVVVFVAITFAVLPQSNAIQIAWIRVATLCAGLSLAIRLLLSTLPSVSLLDVAHVIFRPLMGASVMTLAVMVIGSVAAFEPLTSLILKVTAGLLVYPAAVLAIWWACGQPVGAETYLIDKGREVSTRARRSMFPQESGV